MARNGVKSRERDRERDREGIECPMYVVEWTWACQTPPAFRLATNTAGQNVPWPTMLGLGIQRAGEITRPSTPSCPSRADGQMPTHASGCPEFVSTMTTTFYESAPLEPSNPTTVVGRTPPGSKAHLEATRNRPKEGCRAKPWELHTHTQGKNLARCFLAEICFSIFLDLFEFCCFLNRTSSASALL